MDKNRDEVTNGVASLTQKLTKGKLYLKGRAKVANAHVAPVIYYRLSIVPCLVYWLCLLFRILWKGHVPLVRRSICNQQPMNEGLCMPWLLMCEHALKSQHLQRFHNSEQLWSAFVR